MTAATALPRSRHPARRVSATHLFAVGQVVRLTGGFGPVRPSTDLYRITATLPPTGDSPQYRIRNAPERHERVTPEDSLAAVQASSAEPGAALIEKTFGGAGRVNAGEER
ncbi:MAG: hypothetical protein AB7P02_01695 [Alphaproteobacteria bacterium]